MPRTSLSSCKGALTPGWVPKSLVGWEYAYLSSHTLTYSCLFFSTSLTANSIFGRKGDGQCMFWINSLVHTKERIDLKESVQISNINQQYKSLSGTMAPYHLLLLPALVLLSSTSNILCFSLMFFSSIKKICL